MGSYRSEQPLIQAEGMNDDEMKEKYLDRTLDLILLLISQ